MAENKYIHSEIVVDSEGKKHKVYPTQLKYIPEVAEFISKVNPDFIFSNFMVAKTDEFGVLERTDDGKLIYGKSFTEELLDIVEIALRHKEKREDIAEWIDICVAQEIVEILIGMSQLKKKKELKNPIGTD
jgi:hypothetical protein